LFYLFVENLFSGNRHNICFGYNAFRYHGNWFSGFPVRL